MHHGYCQKLYISNPELDTTLMFLRLGTNGHVTGKHEHQRVLHENPSRMSKSRESKAVRFRDKNATKTLRTISSNAHSIETMWCKIEARQKPLTFEVRSEFSSNVGACHAKIQYIWRRND